MIMIIIQVMNNKWLLSIIITRIIIIIIDI